MGGNAFDGLKRLAAADYKDYEARVLKYLQGIYQQHRCVTIVKSLILVIWTWWWPGCRPLAVFLKPF